VPASGDRLVVRQIAPPDTLGGGRVLDPHPRRHGPTRDALARLERLARGEEVPPEPTGRARPAPRTPSAARPNQRRGAAAAWGRRRRRVIAAPSAANSWRQRRSERSVSSPPSRQARIL
jgi:hypothetical protein